MRLCYTEKNCVQAAARCAHYGGKNRDHSCDRQAPVSSEVTSSIISSRTIPEDRIVCLDKLTYAGNLQTLEEAMKNPNFRFVKGDIADRECVFKLFEEEKFDIVVNFAAESHVDRSIENPEVFLKTNVMGTQVLLDACRKYGVKRYHQVSTDEVYGDLPLDRTDLFFTEETPIHTSSPYSASKAGARPARPGLCTVRSACRCRFPAARTTTARITSPRS